jgi:hypothetical protein
LVAAVESERLGDQDVGRVREFLRRTDSGKDHLRDGNAEEFPPLMINPSVQAAAERAERERLTQQATARAAIATSVRGR